MAMSRPAPMRIIASDSLARYGQVTFERNFEPAFLPRV
jgi:hypothetical protein